MNDIVVPSIFAASPLDHLTLETALMLDAPLDLRLAYCDRDMFITSSVVQEILEFLQWLYTLPRGPRRRCLMILSMPGMGKTWLVREFLRRNGIDRYSYVGADGRRPVLRLSLASVADEEEFILRLMRALGSPTPARRKWKELKDRAIELLQASDTQMVVMDECQDLGKVRPKDLPGISFYLRHLCNEGERPLVLLGSSDAQHLILGCEHLRSRFEVVTMHPWSELEESRAFVFSLLSLLPLPEPSPVTDEDTIRLFLEKADGNTERMSLAIKAAGRTAIKKGAKYIDRAMLLKSCGGASFSGSPASPTKGEKDKP